MWRGYGMKGVNEMAYDHAWQCREIMTKAVCGKGRKYTQKTHAVVLPYVPTSILGAWMMNHRFETQRVEEGVVVTGAYEMHVWYSYERNSKTDVYNETAHYEVLVTLADMDPHHHTASEQIITQVTQEPSCVEARVDADGATVTLRVEWELEVELVAETKLCVVVCAGGCDEDAHKHKYETYSEDADGLLEEHLFEQTRQGLPHAR